MDAELTQLIAKTRNRRMTPAELEAQTQSWVFGNGNIENPEMTREVVQEAARRSSRVADSA